jgi:hypothetical protein
VGHNVTHQIDSGTHHSGSMNQDAAVGGDEAGLAVCDNATVPSEEASGKEIVGRRRR